MPPRKPKARAVEPIAEPATPPPPAAASPPIVPDPHPASTLIVENLLAPEFFATEAQSISLVQGMISIAFSSSRYDYSQTPSVLKKVTVSRIVMSPVGAQALAVRLFAFLDQKGFGAGPKDPKQRQ